MSKPNKDEKISCVFCGAKVSWSFSWPSEDSPDRVCKGCIPEDVAAEMATEDDEAEGIQ